MTLKYEKENRRTDTYVQYGDLYSKCCTPCFFPCFSFCRTHRIIRRSNNKWLHIRVVCFPAGSFPPHIKEAAERDGIIAVLIMVCCIIGICHNEYIIVGVIRANRVKADDDLPMSAPVHPVHHDRRTVIQRVGKKSFKVIQRVKIPFGFCVGGSLPSNVIKKPGNIFNRRSLSSGCPEAYLLS